jgi:steroid delta-isomerase-like uncharacterized protein
MTRKKVWLIFFGFLVVITLMVMSCNSTENREEVADMSEENMTIVRHLCEEIGKGNLDVINEHYAADCVYHSPAYGDLNGPEGVRLLFESTFATFPDLCFTVEDIIADVDTIAARYLVTGTHRGELMGVPPTNNQVIWTAMDISRFEDGKIVETWHEANVLGMLQQIGAIPAQ